MYTFISRRLRNSNCKGRLRMVRRSAVLQYRQPRRNRDGASRCTARCHSRIRLTISSSINGTGRQVPCHEVLTMNNALKIDFVSDVVCPWCAIGLAGLNTALERIGPAARVDFTIHPFELNPNLPAAGETHLEHITEKYGITADQARVNREQIRARAAAVGFTMNRDDDSRVYNTFDAHRLLTWAKEKNVQAEEALWAQRGISSVPAVVVNDRYLISGGQPPEVFEEQLRAILAGADRE